LVHARLIVDATGLPVSADLENGFGEAPKVVAETIRLAAEVGLVGCSIEDATGNQDSPLYGRQTGSNSANRLRPGAAPECQQRHQHKNAPYT
jgi:2-methylisocitrate lyase-like PEP mutase family enzyme